MSKKEIMILRDLAKRYVEICNKDVQNERRDLWRKHNSLIKTRPLILTSWHYGSNVWDKITQYECKCEDPLYRGHELWLRNMIFHDTIGDDYIFEPWITQHASYTTSYSSLWGVEYHVVQSSLPTSEAWIIDPPPLKDYKDIARLVKPHHIINEEETARNVSRLQDTIGDIFEVNIDRAPMYRSWGGGDISTDLGYLRGIGQLMLDMVDNPKGLHKLLAFLRDSIMTVYDEAEAVGDWHLSNSNVENQGQPYSQELSDPKPNGPSVKRDKLWFFNDSQEFTLVSPEMHDEFLLQYQLPIMEKFGLVAYGCCEDLTTKIDILRKIPNLRRIAVTPRANVARCAEQIQQDYVLSWRLNPAMVSCGFNPEDIRKVIRDELEASKGCYVDIILKDVTTVEGHPERLKEWTKIVREIADDY